MPISPKQVALLLARFSEAGIFSGRVRLDWLYERDVDVNKFEEMTAGQLDRILPELRRLGE